MFSQARRKRRKVQCYQVFLMICSLLESQVKKNYIHDVNLTRKKANNGVQLAPIQLRTAMTTKNSKKPQGFSADRPSMHVLASKIET